MVNEVLTKQCAECGNDFDVELDADLNGKWARAALSWVTRCGDCVEAEEREENAKREKIEAHERQVTYEKRLAQSGLPSELQRLTFDMLDRDDDRREAIDAAEAWSRGEFKGMILSGQVGVGKTHIAAVAMMRLLWDQPCDWVRVGRLVIQSKAKLGGEQHGEMERVLLNTGALVLDDIDKVAPTPHTLELLFEAIDSRITEGQPLFITTNLHYDEFAETFKDSIASRVRGYCKGFGMTGPDRRVNGG
jgi:DNA replication protein DnaC